MLKMYIQGTDFADRRLQNKICGNKKRNIRNKTGNMIWLLPVAVSSLLYIIMVH